MLLQMAAVTPFHGKTACTHAVACAWFAIVLCPAMTLQAPLCCPHVASTAATKETIPKLCQAVFCVICRICDDLLVQAPPTWLL